MKVPRLKVYHLTDITAWQYSTPLLQARRLVAVKYGLGCESHHYTTEQKQV
jgi:hypothetical protein